MHTLTGRRSTSLRALAEQQANERHTRRLAELHTLAPLLRELLPWLAAELSQCERPQWALETGGG